MRNLKETLKDSPLMVAILLAAVITISLMIPRTLAFLPGLAGLLLYGVWPLVFSSPRPSPGWPLFAALGIAALAAFSALWSPEPSEVLERSLKIGLVLAPATLWVATLSALPDRTKIILGRMLSVMLGLASVFFVSEFIRDFPVLRYVLSLYSDDVLSGFATNRSMIVFTILLLPAIVAMMRDPEIQHRKHVFLLFIMVITLPAVLLTQSQSAQMGYFAGILTLALFPVGCRASWIALKAFFCIAILTAPFVATYIFAAIPHDTISHAMDQSLLYKAHILPRLEIWDFVSRHVLGHFWIGSGVEATRMVEAFDSRQLYQPGLTLLHPHNGILQIWMEFGLTGAVLASFAISMLLCRLSQIDDVQTRRLSLAVLIALFAVGVVAYGLWQGWWLGLVLFAAGLCKITQRQAVT